MAMCFSSKFGNCIQRRLHDVHLAGWMTDAGSSDGVKRVLPLPASRVSTWPSRTST